jgi:mxaA protein
MSITMLKLLSLTLLFLSQIAFSYEDPKKYPDLDEKFYNLSIQEPSQKVGYFVGDIIQRQIKISVKEPYKLIEESLPIVGYEKRYRGQLLGITLREVIKNQHKDYLELDLTYQIFTNNTVAKPAFITADYYRVINKNKPEDVLKIRVPGLTVAVSPIAIFGAVKVENDMSDLRGPFLIDVKKYEINIYKSLLIFGLSLFVLIYIYTRFTILPGFKKIFLPIHRKFKKNKEIKIESMIRSIHNGLNLFAEASLFEKNLQDLYKKNESFKNIDQELKIFFKISNQKLFTKEKNIDEKIKNWLIEFCFHLHLCEKKLPIKSIDLKIIKI